MKQYIDRNALLKELYNDLNNDINIYHSHTAKEIRDEKYEFAIDRIEEASVADVRENIHAKWENINPYRTLDGQYLKGQICGNCHAYFMSNGNEPYSNHPYCCECGAIMDLK